MAAYQERGYRHFYSVFYRMLTNIAQISYLLGHECIQTTMVYLEITTEQESKALETLEDENQKKILKKWKSIGGEGLEDFLGLR